MKATQWWKNKRFNCPNCRQDKIFLNYEFWDGPPAFLCHGCGFEFTLEEAKKIANSFMAARDQLAFAVNNFILALKNAGFFDLLDKILQLMDKRTKRAKEG